MRPLVVTGPPPICAQALARRKVLSAPLVVAPALEDLGGEDPPEGPSLLGWIDIADMLRGLLSHLRAKHRKLPTNMLQLMTELETEGKVFSYKPLVTLHGGEDRSLLYSSEAGEPLLAVLREQFLGGGGACQGANAIPRVAHRVALFDAHGAITAVVSQLDVVRFVARRSETLLGSLAAMPLSQLGLPWSKAPLVAVDANMPTLLAFDRMLAAGVSGAPVVSPSGELVANLSLSDLRCIQPEHLGVLALPVAEFLALLHRTTYLGYSQDGSKSKDHPFFAGSPKHRAERGLPSPGGPRDFRPPAPPAAPPGEPEEVRLLSVPPDAPLRDLLHALAENGVHRVYIVEPSVEGSAVKAQASAEGGFAATAAAPPAGQLVGVVTPTDVLCMLAGVPPPARTRAAVSPAGSSGLPPTPASTPVQDAPPAPAPRADARGGPLPDVMVS